SPAAPGADAEPDVPGPQAVDPVHDPGRRGPDPGDGQGPEPDARAAPPGPRHFGPVPRIHAEVRAPISVWNRDPRPAAGAPAAADGPDELAHAVAFTPGP